MRSRRSHKLKPFRDYRAGMIMKAMSGLSPVVSSFSVFRGGISRGVKKLKDIVLGVVDEDDIARIGAGLLVLKAESEYALMSAISVIGSATEPLTNLAEYESFSAIALPEMGARARKMLWNPAINEAVVRHFKAMAIIRGEAKSAPRYRKQGHDYSEDALEMITRTMMRPAIVRFSRFVESTLGWTCVENSGVLAHVPIAPKFEIKSAQVQ